jgi:hypothetical protein
MDGGSLYDRSGTVGSLYVKRPVDLQAAWLQAVRVDEGLYRLGIPPVDSPTAMYYTASDASPLC